MDLERIRWTLLAAMMGCSTPVETTVPPALDRSPTPEAYVDDNRACTNDPGCDDPTEWVDGFARCPLGWNRACAESTDWAPVPDLDETCIPACTGRGACVRSWDCLNDYTVCTVGCSVDADCGSRQACIPSEFTGQASQCSIASCATNADCASGACGLFFRDSNTFLQCRPATPECTTAADCPDPPDNYFFDEATCFNQTCGQTNRGSCDGRPFTVDGSARTAPVRRARGWSASADTTGPVDPQLAAHWEAIARAEHASVASFSRFSLQLMALGAPSELVRGAHEAALDEVRHAEIAFALASSAAGEPRSAGPLSLAGVALDVSLEAFVVGLIEEACVGETLAAIVVAEAASSCTRSDVAASLHTIAHDELGHAALGWRTLAWVLAEHPSLHGFVERTFARVLVDPPVPTAPGLHRPADGVIGRQARHALNALALAEVLRPCATALLDREVPRQAVGA